MNGFPPSSTLKELRLSYVAPTQRRLAAFWTWWIGELISLLPPAVQSALLERNQCDFVEHVGDSLVLSRGTASERTERVRIPLNAPRPELTAPRGGETVLLLPSDVVLVKTMALPLAAEENLREVLSFEMSRQTPFSADQVYYDYLVTERDTRRGTLSVDLILAPRGPVEQLVETVARGGRDCEVVSTRDLEGTRVLPINLLPTPKRSKATTIRRRLNAAIGIAAMVLMVIALSFPPLQKRQMLNELEPQLADAIGEANVANESRRELDRLIARSRYLIEKKLSGSSVMRTMNEVTRVLPDDTWINRLDIRENQVELQGRSSSSASLISLLEGSPVFENVRFRSPVTRVANTDEERFHLSADVTKRSAP